MSNPSLASIAKHLGKPCSVTVAVTPKASWLVPAILRDARTAFGRTDYLVEPVAPLSGPAAWIESSRVKDAIYGSE